MSRLLLLSLVAMTLLETGRALASGDPLAEGRRLFDAGRLQEAARRLSELLERHPAESEALKLRALAESGLGDFDAAVRDYETVLEKNGDDAETQRDLGMILAFKKKDARHALLHLDHYLSLTKDAEESPEAVRAAKVMRSLDASHSRVESRAVKELIEMAQSFQSEGNDRVAMQAYERVLEISPTCAACHEALGRLLLNRHHREDGERHLAKARLFGSSG